MFEKNKNYKFNFKHYLNYFWENYKIGLKEQFEYKTNLYIGIFLWATFSISILVFGKILFNNFGKMDLKTMRFDKHLKYV